MTTEPAAIESADRAIAGSAPRGARRRQRQMSFIDDSATPLVKWAGGKARVLPELMRRLPAEYSRYIEPFAGGAALFFCLSSSDDPRPAVLGDANADLIGLYQEVARDASAVSSELGAIVGAHAADPIGCYYGWRAAWNAERYRWSAPRRAAVFLYLNRASFNGLFRLNRSGHMNVPIGRPSAVGGPHPVVPTSTRMVAAGMALSRAVVRCCDYVDLIAEAQRGDFVYLDPPYLPRSGTSSFAAYTSDGFGVADHQEMADRAIDLAGRGVLVMVSSADVPGARDLYPGFDVHEISVSRPVSASSSGRAKVGELILTSGYEVAPAAGESRRPAARGGA